MTTIDPAFLTHAAHVLADTDNGLSGREICDYFAKYAVIYKVSIPFSQYPFPKGTFNKRTVFLRNISQFSELEQFLIIKELCQLDKFNDNQEAQRLFSQLEKYYGHLAPLNITKEFVDNVTKLEHFLDNYPLAKKQYEQALEKKSVGIYNRNMLDDLRLSFELLVKQIINTKQSFGNLKGEIGGFLKKNNVSEEITTLINGTIFGFFKPYLNENVKHNDNFNFVEIDLVFNQVTSVMLFLIQLDKKQSTNDKKIQPKLEIV